MAGGCWAALIASATTGTAHPGHHVAGHAAALGPADVAGFVAGWLIMLGAMMLPVAAPAVGRLAGRAATGAVLVFLGVFTAAWTAFGLLALAGDVAVHEVVAHWDWLGRRPALVLATVLTLAGAALLVGRWSPRTVAVQRRGAVPAGGSWVRRRAAWRAGVRFSGASLICDGPLMLVMFAVGPEQLGAMATVAAVMVAQRHPRWSSGVTIATGCALVLAAVVVAVPAGTVPGGR